MYCGPAHHGKGDVSLGWVEGSSGGKGGKESDGEETQKQEHWRSLGKLSPAGHGTCQSFPGILPIQFEDVSYKG